MPIKRTDKIDQVKQRLVERLRHGYYRPGDRFLSNRAVAELFGISYQTAHRLIVELCREGQLERRPQSGTYVPGATTELVGVQLFDDRAVKPDSFGAKLLASLTKQIEAERIDWKIDFAADVTALDLQRLPILWEQPLLVAECARRSCSAIMVDDRPASGLDSLYIDSVSVDDFSGGACAGQLLKERTGKQRGFVVVAGPKSDHRSRSRMQGFTSIIDAAVVQAGSWFYDDGYHVAEQAVRRGKAGIFCVNDQLASSIVGWCRDHERRCPPIIGFDDAPIAERLNLTTISLPWDEINDGVLHCVKRRLSGDRSTSSHQLFQPRPVVRGFGPGDGADRCRMNEPAPDTDDVPLPPRKAERLLCDCWPEAIAGSSPSRILTTTLGRAEATEFIARRHPEAAVVCSMLDRYAADVAAASLVDRSPNLDLRCEADFSCGEGLDAAAIPTSSQGEAELTREQLQAAYVSLRPGGFLLTTTDNPRDRWLGEVVETYGGEVRRIPASDGVGYLVRRAESPPKRVRDFRAEFAFRDGERLISVESRPGVFSHRRIDPGARRLIESLELRDGDKVLDVGCGWGAVGLAAACRAQVDVLAIDSNARAVACTNRNAGQNGVADRLAAKVEAHGRTDAPGSFDWALANPPYYAQFEIAERFVVACQTALRPGGQLRIVTKHPEWYLDRLPGPFADVTPEAIKGYAILRARKR